MPLEIDLFEMRYWVFPKDISKEPIKEYAVLNAKNIFHLMEREVSIETFFQNSDWKKVKEYKTELEARQGLKKVIENAHNVFERYDPQKASAFRRTHKSDEVSFSGATKGIPQTDYQRN